MTLLAKLSSKDPSILGEELHRFVADLYPICRSISGDGVRQTLAAVGQRIPIRTSEIPTGTEVLDWTIPKEWNIRDAWIKNAAGERVVDFQRSNLHVMSYSIPVNARMPLSDLKAHLLTIPEHPDLVPYRTSYYKENWGFCLSHNQMSALEDGAYEVVIDSTLEDGSLTLAECLIPGETTDEVLISSHICHPSLANDNLSSIAVATSLAELLLERQNRYSYRFLFAPGTIGAIAWLARNREDTSRIRHGLVLAGIGDNGGFHYKKSRRGDAEIDRIVAQVLRHSGEPAEILEFIPYGYDERQYCSPGFNLPIGCLMRSVWGTFPEYHTSADNLDFVQPRQLAGSLRVLAGVVDALEDNLRYCNTAPYGEPQLGKRDLYRSTGGETIGDQLLARLWVLNLSDGQHSLLDISERSGLNFPSIRDAAMLLREGGLLLPASQASA